MAGKKRSVKTSIRLFKKNLWIALSLFGASFLMPFIINVDNLAIYGGIYSSIEMGDQGLLVINSFKLVLMNALRILPVYMASFTFLEAMKDIYQERVPFLPSLLGFFIVPLLYVLIGLFPGLHYDFGPTSLVIILSIAVLTRIDLSRISILKKAVFVILLLIGLQWVDIIPALSPYWFGRGEISYDIKMTAEFMGADRYITFLASLFSFFFIIMALMILKLLKDQNGAVREAEKRTQMEIEYGEIKMQSLRNRTLEEMQNLVHDLKTPLTSIQALVSLSELLVTDEKVGEYMGKINRSVDQLNGMISEILHGDKRTTVEIGTLLESIRSQMSPRDESRCITYHNRLPHGRIRVNRIRFSRMIINLVNNSLNALAESEGWIEITVRDRDNSLIMEIIDNGRGIKGDLLMKIKERGFSTSGSTGLGLRYVEDVAANHGGRMMIESTEGIGTRIKLEFNKETIGYEEHTDN